MLRKYEVLIMMCTVMLLAPAAVWAQAPAGPQAILPEKHDTSPPIRMIVPEPASKVPGVVIEFPAPLPTPNPPALKSPILDPVLQTSQQAISTLALQASTASMPPPIINFEGIAAVDGLPIFNFLPYPPDTNGDVGPNHYVQMVNGLFAVYDKAGHKLLGPKAYNTVWLGFSGECENNVGVDPIVLYDHLADRWFLSFINNNHLCIALSTTGDPTGSYYRYDYEYIYDEDPTIPDYPKYGLWPDAYYLSGHFAGSAAFDRKQMLLGNSAKMVLFRQVGPFFTLPSDLDGPPPPAGTPNIFVGLDSFQLQLQLWNVHVDFKNTANSTFTLLTNLPIAAFNHLDPAQARHIIPQPDTTVRLDSVSYYLMMRLQYRNQSNRQTLVLNHTVDADGTGHAGIRWYELENTGDGWSLYQQGTYAPDSDHRWMGSIAADKDGNLALGYSVSSAKTYPSIRYAGRLATDPLDVLAQAEVELVAGNGYQTNTLDPANDGRWGDYSMMAVDPTDNCTFWYTQEYYAVPGVPLTRDAAPWQTRVGSFRFPSCQPLVSLVGDKDNIDAGNAADSPFRSDRVKQMLQNLLATGGYTSSVDLDVNAPNQLVGWTHQFNLPNDALITSATIKLRLKGNDSLVSNDELLYEQTALDTFRPFIALQDLNGGKSPTAGDPFELTLNLAKTPVRIACPECASGENPNPLVTTGANKNGEFRDLLPLLFDGQFDLVLGDDSIVDYSELNITYVLPSAATGDLNGNGVIDKADVDILNQSLNTAAYTDRTDPRDLDHNGIINVLDARKLVLLCTKKLCAS